MSRGISPLETIDESTTWCQPVRWRRRTVAVCISYVTRSPLPCLVEIVAVYYCITDPPPLCFWITLSSASLRPRSDSSCREKRHNTCPLPDNFAMRDKLGINGTLTKSIHETLVQRVRYRMSNIHTLSMWKLAARLYKKRINNIIRLYFVCICLYCTLYLYLKE